MANTRSMTIKQKKFSTSDNDNLASWSNLNHDLLLLIMMQVGVVDFIAFSGVCKQWRSVAVSNWNKFMVSQQPMRLSACLNRKNCYLEDYKKRKLKITIPHSKGGICVGITCGYLIFYGRETHDFWLVNPFTKKQLHFPGFPFAESTSPIEVRGILVFSPSMSGWVLVVINKCLISFSLAGKQARWRNVTSDSGIHDLHFFKGKIYLISIGNRLLEFRLNPEPALTLLKMKNFPWPHDMNLGFVSSGENLYVRDIMFMGNVFQAVEVDFDEMKWVNPARTIGEYAVFVTDFYKSDAAIKPDTWAHAHPWTQYERLDYFKNKKRGTCFTRKMWYFPHDCLNVKDPDMKNGNILKD